MNTYPLLTAVLTLVLLTSTSLAAAPRATPLEVAQGMEMKRAAGPYDPTRTVDPLLYDSQRDTRFF